jgi:regulation of enolase protein 1 (concanavalin A-like superfamily)
MSRGVRFALSVWVLLACSLPGRAGAQTAWSGTDIGSVGVAGSVTTSASRVRITGEGLDIGGTSDSCYFAYRTLSANGQITAKVSSLTAVDALTKGGVVLRQTLSANAINASLVVTPSRGLLFQQRTSTGGQTVSTNMSGIPPVWVRLVRYGSKVVAYRSADGTSWTFISAADIGLQGTVYVGVAVASHRASQIASAQFDSVALSTTVAAPPAGPVAAWAFDEGTGTSVQDSIGTNHGTLSGGALWTAGRYGRSVSFDGVDDTASVPDAAALDLSAAATVEAWVMPASVAGPGSVVAKQAPTGVAYQLQGSDEAGRPAGSFNAGTGDVRVTGPSSLAVNTWSHVAATYDGSALRIFVNGAQVASRGFTGRLTQTTGVLRIGGGSVLADWFQGRIDDLRIYNRALVATEIQTDRNIPVRPMAASGDSTPPTVAVTSPAAGAIASGTVTLAASASDNTGVTTVQFRVNGVNSGAADTVTPFGTTWTTTGLAAGTYSITAVASDAAGNAATSAPVTVTLGDATAPTVTVTSPATGSTASGSVALAASATDNVGVTSVQFRVNGSNVGAADTAAPYAGTWSTTGLAAGTYTVTAVATDAAGNQATSSGVSVTIATSVIVNARSVSFTSLSQNAIATDGQAVITSYELEVWTAGSNTTTGTPYRTSNMGKPATTSTDLTIDQQAFFAALPTNQQFISTVRAVGPGGSARSDASNAFTMQ